MGTTLLQIDELPEEVRAEIDAGAKAPYAIEHLDCMPCTLFAAVAQTEAFAVGGAGQRCARRGARPP